MEKDGGGEGARNPEFYKRFRGTVCPISIAPTAECNHILQMCNTGSTEVVRGPAVSVSIIESVLICLSRGHQRTVGSVGELNQSSG